MSRQQKEQTETSIHNSTKAEITGEVSNTKAVEEQKHIDRTERQTGGSVLLSAPDSTGKQYPLKIKWYDNNMNEKINATKLMEEQLQLKINSLEVQLVDLEQKTNFEEIEKTSTKIGLTFLEKIGIGAIIVLVLTVIFIVFKFYLKK
ncbi:MAG: hypothetical protein LBT04_02020 [Prevotellaceae bacterium]|nr:hypothetical protein [Prevotellaceae bacterium]